VYADVHEIEHRLRAVGTVKVVVGECKLRLISRSCMSAGTSHAGSPDILSSTRHRRAVVPALHPAGRRHPAGTNIGISAALDRGAARVHCVAPEAPLAARLRRIADARQQLAGLGISDLIAEPEGDGDVWSSAGVTAGIDLSLALVEEDLGRGLALGVARNLVVFLKRPGGQAQFSAALSLQSADDGFADLHSWLAEHLADHLSLSRLAAQAGMSERSFLRRYREATGMTPARAVERLRIEPARQLLVETRLPAKRIAAPCGFGSEETMRRSFAPLQASAHRTTGSASAAELASTKEESQGAAFMFRVLPLRAHLCRLARCTSGSARIMLVFTVAIVLTLGRGMAPRCAVA
jgi:AraC-like DNA-binding protein